jgi:hypothetical protein
MLIKGLADQVAVSVGNLGERASYSNSRIAQAGAKRASEGAAEEATVQDVIHA